MPATPTKVTESVSVKAIKTIFVEYSKDEIKQINDRLKDGKTAAGMTKRIEPGDETSLSVKDAKKLQKSGAVEIILD